VPEEIRLLEVVRAIDLSKVRTAVGCDLAEHHSGAAMPPPHDGAGVLQPLACLPCGAALIPQMIETLDVSSNSLASCAGGGGGGGSNVRLPVDLMEMSETVAFIKLDGNERLLSTHTTLLEAAATNPNMQSVRSALRESHLKFGGSSRQNVPFSMTPRQPRRATRQMCATGRDVRTM
jgi:hypothetical protein